MRSRTQKAFLNMSVSLVEQIVVIVCGLIAPRLILSTFGSTYNGVVSSATQFLNMINILALGITASIRASLYKPLALGDTLAVSRIMKSTKKYMRKIALCVIIYAAILCVVYPLFSKNELSAQENAALIAIVSVGSFANYFFGKSSLTLLQAAQMSYISHMVNILKTIINTLCVVVLIYLKCDIYTVKLVSSIIFFLAPAFLNLYIKKKFSLTNNCTCDNSGIKARKATALHSIANSVHDNVDLVTLTFFTDAKIISIYTVYYFAIGRIKSLFQVLSSGMEAAFGDMWAKSEIEKLNKNFRVYEYLLFTFTTIVFSCVGVLILPFVTVYTLGVVDINYILPTLAILVTIAEAMHCIRQPYLTLVYATGSFNETKWGAVAEAIINILVSVILVNFWGIAGVVVGTLIANTFRTVQFSLFVSKNILKRSIWNVIRRFAWTVATSGTIIFLSLLATKLFTFDISWTGWIVEAAFVFVISVAVTMFSSLIFYKKDVSHLFKTGLNVFKRKKA